MIQTCAQAVRVYTCVSGEYGIHSAACLLTLRTLKLGQDLIQREDRSEWRLNPLGGCPGSQAKRITLVEASHSGPLKTSL